ncbi:hypothetical protein WR25_07504 [Diploscapter pachys]|uniref:C-type lectin domain-containing protein n=1 Tax=Diploscapter pachys TaxID=2018661 RepID=A0A2A2JKL9_9BILA|nr:hypothetical protein WR25_07504 [Diploscapter pachys]
MFPAIMHLTVDTTQANLVTNTRRQSKISTTIGTTEELPSTTIGTTEELPSTTIGTTEELPSRTTPQTTTTVLPTQPYLTTPDLCDLDSTKSKLIQDIDNASPLFKKIASEGYYISSLSNNSIIQVSEAIMRANCFCNAPMSAYHYELPVADSSYANGGCYSLQITATSFNTANSSCQRIGANVASLKDESKVDFILSLILDKGFYKYQSIWIDLHEIDGNWQWGDGQQIDVDPDPKFRAGPTQVEIFDCITGRVGIAIFRPTNIPDYECMISEP